MSRSGAWRRAPTSPMLPDDEVHVWRIELEPPTGSWARLAGRLSTDERRRAARFRFERDRRRFCAARGALRELLAGYLGEEPERLRFVEGPHGKPELAHAEASELRFNLTHSGELALCAVSRRRELGIDLEQVRELPDAEALARRFFSSGENQALEELPAERRLPAFFRLWTRKEAYLKAVGAGLLQPLDAFDVSLFPEAGECALDLRGRPDQTALWSLVALEVDPGYVAALVAARPAWRPVCWAFMGPPEPAPAQGAAGS